MSTKIVTDKNTSKFSTKELLDIFNFKEIIDADESYSICTDSRTIKTDQIFLPISGEKYDGHDFINSVFEKDVKYSFCDAKKIQKINEKFRKSLILVDDTLNAYHEIAKYYKRKISPKTITITGSSGKTTIKDLIATILSTKYKVHKTEANFNNEIGVPKTILEMPEDTQVLVLELAMRAKGEIRFLAKTAEADITVITNVGSAHIGRLGSLQAIIEAKCEILEHLKNEGIAIVHNNPDLIKCAGRYMPQHVPMTTFDLAEAKNITFKNGKTNFTFEDKNYTINAPGKIHVLNSLCAMKTAEKLNLSFEEIKKGLIEFTLPQGRGNIISLKGDKFLIDESYNANPESLKAAITSLIECWNSEYKKIVVIGELAELGGHESQLLTELNDWVNKMPLDHVITVGDKIKAITYKSSTNVRNIEECCAILNNLFTSKSVVLVKGSRVAGLEKLVNYFSNK